MDRRFRKDESNVFVHPNIIDIEVKHEKTTINFEDEEKENQPKKISRRSRKKTRERNKNKPKDDEQEPVNDNDQKAEEVEAVKPAEGDDKKVQKFPDHLQGTCRYDFDAKIVVLCFYASKDFEWSLYSISGLYDYTLEVIKPADCIETGNDFVYNMRNTHERDAIARIFKISIASKNRHILMQDFSWYLSYVFLDDPNFNLYNSKFTTRIPFFQKETRLQFKFLGHYHADRDITELFNYKFRHQIGMERRLLDLLMELNDYQRKKHDESRRGNSTKMIKYALNIEDLESQNELKDFVLPNLQLSGTMDYYWFNATRKMLPPNFEDLSLCLVPMHKYQEGRLNTEIDSIFAQVDKYEHGRVYFEKKFRVDRENVDAGLRLHVGGFYCVRFIPNRITFRACFQALDTIAANSLVPYFDSFDDFPYNSNKDNGHPVTHFEWLNQQIAENEEQKTAIQNIVNCTAYPYPYIVFGPPGTGKTSLIVECIAQILLKNPNGRIMVTAQSNSACDEVGERLLKHISGHRIFRYYSPSLLNPENGETSEALRKTSNLRNDKSEYPTLEEFFHFNVVIVTLMSCSRLVQFTEVKMNKHFDYIFVDECAAAMEPEAYVPIIGLGTDSHEITTNIVLLGDHKQLGPVISSDMAAQLGLGESLMERIMSKRRYQMNPVDKTFDKRYVTQLLDNFRSHPAILQFSNVLFYESKLRAKLQEPELSFGTSWQYLNNRKFPVLFHCVKTPSKIQRGGTSSYNEGELKLVKFYVDLLLNVGVNGVTVEQTDIGIVSPYKAQLFKLAELLEHHSEVEIGTAEYYQGREKKIIIISTVKSRDSVGFLKSEKRLNVCITRAKSLLIIVGNADTLQQNSLWNSFMHFCKANDACCGEDFTLKRLTDAEQKILDEVNSIFTKGASTEEEKDVVINKNEALKEIEDRMKKIEMLTKKM